MQSQTKFGYSITEMQTQLDYSLSTITIAFLPSHAVNPIILPFFISFSTIASALSISIFRIILNVKALFKHYYCNNNAILCNTFVYPFCIIVLVKEMNGKKKIKLENLRKIRAYSILAKGDMPKVVDNATWIIPSQNNPDRTYNVWNEHGE